MDTLDRIVELIKNNYATDAAFEKAFGVKRKTVDSWKRGNSKSYNNKISELARFFKVSTDYLLTGHDYNKPNVIDNILSVMNFQGISMSDLCRATNIQGENFLDWKNHVSNPNMESIKRIAEFLHVSIGHLMANAYGNNLVIESGMAPVGEMNPIPIISSVRYGYGGQTIEEDIGVEYVNINSPHEYRLLKVKGDSMAPNIEEGDLALIHIQQEVESGDLAVIILDGNEGVLQKVIYQDSNIILQSFNPAYPPNVLSNTDHNRFSIFGKCIKTERRW